MTSQPDSPATDRTGIDEEDAMEAEQAPASDYRTADSRPAGTTSEAFGSPAAQDPDLILVAGEVVEEDADPNAFDTEADAGDDLTESDLTGSGRDDEYAMAGGVNLATAEATGTTDLTGAAQPAADLGQQWHDIQAMFVDDPRGSVELAAAATESAVSALLETLHQRQSALVPAATTSADPGSTEQLREALRSYRIFCQSLTEIGQRLTQPATMTQ